MAFIPPALLHSTLSVLACTYCANVRLSTYGPALKIYLNAYPSMIHIVRCIILHAVCIWNLASHDRAQYHRTGEKFLSPKLHFEPIKHNIIFRSIEALTRFRSKDCHRPIKEYRPIVLKHARQKKLLSPSVHLSVRVLILS